MLTACPSQTIAKAKSSSAKLATYANSGVDLTRELFRSNFINLATKDKIADGFIVLAKAGQAFDLAVANAEKQYGADVPKDVIGQLFGTFNSEVVAKFVTVLAALKLTNVSGNFGAIIETIKTAVLLIAKAFGKRSVVAAQLG
jgi:hypothetical protein